MLFYKLLPVIVLCSSGAAHAQARIPALPVDTITSEILFQDLLFRHPPKVDNFSEEMVFACPIEQQPEYPGGIRAMYKFIEANLRIPRKARRAGISGKVFTSFTIEVTGDITNVAVLKGIGFGCDEEAIRLVQSMPRWKPAKQYEKIVKVRYNLPISFDIK